uniref:DNA (cytosine-5-)-methyltransferase n=1 Tax=Strigamia maritima TaxID=126957 RepID=T1J9Q0_STRMM
MTPSADYRVYFYPLKEKSFLVHIIINFLEDNEDITYKELIRKIEAATPPQDYEDDIEVTEEAVRLHAEFILEQIASYDESADDVDKLSRTDCIQHLIVLSGKIIPEKKRMQSTSRSTSTNVQPKQTMQQKKFQDKRMKKKTQKECNTKLVNRIFDSIFQDYVCCLEDVNNRENSDFECEIDEIEQFEHDFYEKELKINYFDDFSSTKLEVSFNNVIECRNEVSLFENFKIHGEVFKVGDCIYIDSQSAFHLGKIISIRHDKIENKGGLHVVYFISASDTILGKAASENEYFLSNYCQTIGFKSIKCKSDIVFKPQLSNWKSIGGEDLEEKSINNAGRRFYYSKFHDQKTCRFEDIPEAFNNLDADSCPICEIKNRETQGTISLPRYTLNEEIELNLKLYNSVKWNNIEYKIKDSVFLLSSAFGFDAVPRSLPTRENFREVDEDKYPEYYRKAKSKESLSTCEPYRIGEIVAIYTLRKEVGVRIRKFYRPENTHLGKQATYAADFNLLYMSNEETNVNISAIVSKCKVTYCRTPSKIELTYDQQHFYYNQTYDARSEELTRSETHDEEVDEEPAETLPLATLDLFCGCGGLSEGLVQSGAAKSCWAVDEDLVAAASFKKNHPDCVVYGYSCSTYLSMLMDPDCELNLPAKGEVEFLCGGPPCQGFTGLNKFKDRLCAKLKNSLITTQLSICDWLRPRFFLMENVQNFIRCNDSMVLKSTLRCLIAIGYQCTFGLLQAGNYGVPQRRRRVFILAAAPGEKLPQFPLPTHVFNSHSTNSITIDGIQMIPRHNWPTLAPYRNVTVRDTLSDLPDIEDTEPNESQEYNAHIQSHYQKILRKNNNTGLIRDHFYKRMNAITTERILRIPRTHGADWRDLPNIEIKLSDGTWTKKLEYNHDDVRNGRSRNGSRRGICRCAEGGRKSGVNCNIYRQKGTLIPWFLVHTANDNNQWNGALGRLCLDDVFPIALTKLTISGKIGRVIHPEENRILSVRECARVQGFPDSYIFCGDIHDRHKQIGNAVPPLLARAIGSEIRKCI